MPWAAQSYNIRGTSYVIYNYCRISHSVAAGPNRAYRWESHPHTARGCPGPIYLEHDFWPPVAPVGRPRRAHAACGPQALMLQAKIKYEARFVPRILCDLNGRSHGNGAY